MNVELKKWCHGFIRKQDGQRIIADLGQTQKRQSYFSVFPASSLRTGH